jgi:hypothetical protein
MATWSVVKIVVLAFASAITLRAINFVDDRGHLKFNFTDWNDLWTKTVLSNLVAIRHMWRQTIAQKWFSND